MSGIFVVSPLGSGLPLVSVVIPTYNRKMVLERSIQSVLNQTFRDFELIIVDDGSTDGTSHLLSTYDNKLKVVVQENRGVSAARNAGIRRSTGRLVAFLDSDDEWLHHKLALQTSLFDPSKPYFICHTDELWLNGGKVVHQKPYHRKQGGHFFERALERCLISPSSVVLSRALLDEVGWFDESLPAAEDYDLWLRVTPFHRVDHIPQPLVIKHGGGTDQLSRMLPAIDRFRIEAIIKLLAMPHLPDDYRRAAQRMLVKKCGIVASGLEKRGRNQEAHTYHELARTYQDRSDLAQ